MTLGTTGVILLTLATAAPELAKLKPVFGGKDKVSMFEMNKHLAGHLK